MILAIAGVAAGADISAAMDRESFELEASVGKRMDTTRFTLFDPALVYGVPDRAEVWIYDAAPGAAVTDPPNSISAYNTFKNGAGHEITSTTAANWTPRLFAGYCADVAYALDGAQRLVEISAQDYTVRLRTTVGNFAFAQGQTDQTIIQTVFNKYWPEIDVTNVAQVATGFPAISFPIHTLEQIMERVVRVSRAIYRVDYYKRLFYGVLGQQTAPFNLSDAPNGTTTFGYEGMRYSPMGSGLANKVWIVGSSFLSKVQTFQVPLQLVNGTNWQFGVPGNPELTGLSVKVNGVDQGTVGVTPGDGDIGSQTGWRAGVGVLIQHVPAIVALKNTPANAAVVQITGQFRYPLTTAITDPVAIAAAGGKIFEAIVRDRRVADLTLAQQIGQSFLKNQGVTLKGGSCLIKKRLIGSALIQPGQQILITGVRLFTNLLPGGVTTFTALITKIGMKLTTDAVEPYDITLEFADRQVGMSS